MNDEGPKPSSATTHSSSGRQARLAGLALAIIAAVTFGWRPAGAPGTADPAAAGDSLARAEGRGRAGLLTPLPPSAGRVPSAITIEHVAYDKPHPNVLFKMTDHAAGTVCYYTLAGVPSCLRLLEAQP